MDNNNSLWHSHFASCCFIRFSLLPICHHMSCVTTRWSPSSCQPLTCTDISSALRTYRYLQVSSSWFLTFLSLCLVILNVYKTLPYVPKAHSCIKIFQHHTGFTWYNYIDISWVTFDLCLCEIRIQDPLYYIFVSLLFSGQVCLSWLQSFTGGSYL